MQEIKEYMWSFVRGDLDIKTFEQWVYTTTELEKLDASLYLYLLEYDYNHPNRYDISHLKNKIYDWLITHFPSDCSCIAWKNDEQLNIGHHSTLGFISSEYFKGKFSIINNRTPWLSLRKCQVCKTYWYIGLDTYDDFFILHRVTAEEVSSILNKDIWPTYYDDNPYFWPTPEWFKLTKYLNLDEWRKDNNR